MGSPPKRAVASGRESSLTRSVRPTVGRMGHPKSRHERQSASMSDQPKRFFDLWFFQANNVIKEVPFHVVTDWITQGRAVPDDRVKPSGTADWYPLGTVVAFQPYFPKPGRLADDAYEAMAPVEMDIEWPKGAGVEDEDVDMIPLIDISLV